MKLPARAPAKCTPWLVGVIQLSATVIAAGALPVPFTSMARARAVGGLVRELHGLIPKGGSLSGWDLAGCLSCRCVCFFFGLSVCLFVVVFACLIVVLLVFFVHTVFLFSCSCVSVSLSC